MKNFIFVLIILGVVSGCSAVNEIKEDYLNVDDPSKQSIGEAMETLKTDYLGAKQDFSIVNKKAEVIAYNSIMENAYKDQFDIYKPKVDPEPGMPQMKPYIFVNFQPKEGYENLKGATFLVVVRIFDDRVAYSGLYRSPGGDPFYRYGEVLSEIERK